jgi:hypothetical protein
MYLHQATWTHKNAILSEGIHPDEIGGSIGHPDLPEQIKALPETLPEK